MTTQAFLVWASSANALTVMRGVAKDESVIPTGSEDEHGRKGAESDRAGAVVAFMPAPGDVTSGSWRIAFCCLGGGDQCSLGTPA